LRVSGGLKWLRIVPSDCKLSDSATTILVTKLVKFEVLAYLRFQIMVGIQYDVRQKDGCLRRGWILWNGSKHRKIDWAGL
jgi:hypothetical protein